MNNPLRFAGETFYQSGLNEISPGVDMTILQVVTNDGWMIPYVACMIVAVGMLAHFMIALLRFLNRDAKSATSAENQPLAWDERHGPQMLNPDERFETPPQRAWLTPAISIGLVVILGGYLAGKAVPPKPSEEGFNLYRAGQIPVNYEGRVKPLDTLGATRCGSCPTSNSLSMPTEMSSRRFAG